LGKNAIHQLVDDKNDNTSYLLRKKVCY